MDPLAARFDALQEELMQIYERGESTLDAQIRHWELIRHEQATYFVARRQGITRLGLYPVPSASVSEARAKQAIEMHLLLQSLKKSAYADERWTLVETSFEHFNSPPARTLKKGPTQVTVIYDNNPENAMTYTLWKYVYVLDPNDVWHKLPSDVDYYGIYYTDLDQQRVYYVSFGTDAEQYTGSGQWTVHFANKTFSAPVTSSAGGHSGLEEEQAQGPRQLAARRQATYRGRRSRRSRTPQTPPRSRSRSESRSRSASSSSDTDHRSRSRQRNGGRGFRRGDSTGEHPESEEESGRHSPGPPGSLGRRTAETSGASGRRRTPRVVQLLKDAADPPVLLLRGPANTLKGFRRKARLKYSEYYSCMSTAFSWVSGTCTERLGTCQRMLVAFNSDSQRTRFLCNVHIPRSVTFVKGSFDAL
ncbi:E2 protein [Bos taurus papillomavirus 12]|uniref:Regulatory protein E2 n=1 Tax=Bos taurus papillomavirus 12 TaxID=1070324 RepID=G1CR71_9PAPI|nr:E2 protein [Bos taurus papillomavirus 12]AEL99904.1 E2 protein [Bos taurus papillomavirus 12]